MMDLSSVCDIKTLRRSKTVASTKCIHYELEGQFVTMSMFAAI